MPGRRCPNCASDNPPGMNFCRNCGTRMPEQAAPVVPPGAAPPGSGPIPGMPQVTPPGAYPPPGVSHGGYPGHGAPPGPSAYPPGPSAYPPGPSAYPPGPSAYPPGPASGYRAPSQPTPTPAPAPAPAGPGAAATQSCPHCGGSTPAGYAFCQQCGKKLASAPAPTPAPAAAPTPAPAAAPTPAPTPMSPPVDAVGPTLAASSVPVEVQRLATGGSAGAPGVVESPAWGALISLQRDGSDGARHPLSGEWMELGRDLGDIRFPEDRFLARQHARIERTDAGARIVPLDRLNGVYRRVFDPVQLTDGAQLLLGREVMRFELVDDDERDAAPLVRHGVALFGSPPRAPWGRLSQLLASGGVRDVRYLSSELVVVGREEGDLVFRDDAFLSRRHASFTFANGACTLEDLDSSNGTFLRLAEPTLITTGEQLRMGDQVFRFEYLL